MSKLRTRPLIYVPCDCRTAEHFIRISEDFDSSELLDITFLSTRDCSIWRRIRWALKHVFGSQDLVFADIIVRRDAILSALSDAE